MTIRQRIALAVALVVLALSMLACTSTLFMSQSELYDWLDESTEVSP